VAEGDTLELVGALSRLVVFPRSAATESEPVG
jgi:hypothetical protein